MQNADTTLYTWLWTTSKVGTKLRITRHNKRFGWWRSTDACKAVYHAFFFRFKNGPFLPLLFVTSFLNSLYGCRILCAALGKNKHFIFFVWYGDHTYRVPGTRYFYSNSSYCCRCCLQQVPRSSFCTKRVTSLESSHGHHLPPRAASARAARGRCFDPKRAATAPGCGACSAIREHRVGSVLIVRYDQTHAHSSSSTRSSSTTPDDGWHILRIVCPWCGTESSWLSAGRVWTCTRPVQSVRSSWTGVPSTSCRYRVLRHGYCCCGTSYTTAVS